MPQILTQDVRRMSHHKKEEEKMRNYLAVALVVAILSSVGCGPKGHIEAEKAAIESAKAWLSLVDSEKYEESWEEAAELFKGAVAMDQWLQSMHKVRKPLGRSISRELKSKRYCTSLPGAPDGEYVVIQFKASFENKKEAVETVTPMLDKDAKWRVSGYYIK